VFCLMGSTTTSCAEARPNPARLIYGYVRNNRNTMPRAVTLYGLSRSVYTRIARLTLEEKGVSYRLEEVEIFGASGVPASHIKRHPFGRIPVLTHGELSIYETAAICRYLDEAFPGPSLQPLTPSDRARMAQVIGLLDSYAYRPMVWGVFVQRVRRPLAGGTTDEALVATSLEQTRAALGALAGIAGDSPYLAGGTLSLADLHAYPMLRYLSLAPEGAAAIAEHPAVAGWLARLTTRESVLRTVTELEPQGASGSAA
jgi:glutathione S-transferase